LVRPERISSPMTSTAAVTMALSLGATVIILPRSFGLDGGATVVADAQPHGGHFANIHTNRAANCIILATTKWLDEGRRLKAKSSRAADTIADSLVIAGLNPGQYPPNTDGGTPMGCHRDWRRACTSKV
jgi:hypothetical protein